MPQTTLPCPLVTGPSAWIGADLAQRPDEWTYRLSALEIAENAEQLLRGPLLHLLRHRFGRGAPEPPAQPDRCASCDAEGQGREPETSGQCRFGQSIDATLTIRVAVAVAVAGAGLGGRHADHSAATPQLHPQAGCAGQTRRCSS